ncbi:MAG: LiaF domain-containing protein [Gemmatimonadaceae bacterium]
MSDFPLQPNDGPERFAVTPSFTVVPAADVEPHRGALAFFASVKRRGVWTLARRFRIAAFMAEAKLDLREVRIAAGRNDIEVFALFSSVEIIVPPGIRVDAQDSALMGEMKSEASDFPQPGAEAPAVYVHGNVIASEVSIKVRYQGETEKEAKRRLKQGSRGWGS